MGRWVVIGWLISAACARSDLGWRDRVVPAAPGDAQQAGADASTGADAVVAPGDDAPDPCAIAPQALLGWWTLDADDVSGTTLLDSSGRGSNGTIVGAPPPAGVDGRIDEALDFSGAPFAYAEFSAVALDSTPGATTTLSLWYHRANSAPDEVLAGFPTGPSAAPPRYDLWLTDRFGSVSLCINGGMSDCWGVTDAGLVGRWVHVVAILANGRTDGGRLYVDGVDAAASCLSATCDETRVTAAPFSIASSDADYAWRGMLDDVRLYDRALTPAEIAALFACAP